MAQYVNIPISELNRLLTCKLCSGYFQDAHTIPECMHTFCRHCITTYFQRMNDGRMIQCPTCQTEVGYFHVAITKIIFDRNIQSMVDKIFPIDVNVNDMYNEAHEGTGKGKGKGSKGSNSNNNNNQQEFFVKVLPYPDSAAGTDDSMAIDEGDDAQAAVASSNTTSKLPPLPKPTFKGKKDVKISKIQMFIFRRFPPEVQEQLAPQVGGAEEIEILYQEQILLPNSDLELLVEAMQTKNNNAGAAGEGVEGDSSGSKEEKTAEEEEDEKWTLILHYRRKIA